ncbi:hypothetical protein [Deinococcus wulumuqiensis]|uniref:Lipoprotein n=1 Tax=Deinococcus wulumuqiensis TaxID=980427 RepID=A0AAV4K8Q3_9DEIO|nr:hypothetical protein [Deinococcus wulumuqiensis]QII20080.1 hypothetical protein G6R31_04340 [Deinococcus wulumuqiensis R12]GGI87459.1 hypothetical protein GCM10010914_22420 [Deinococcus wulumuqiensis]GGP30015.1 hypothetical protein GCM10008021_16660 [Deinococcus wulumuqiensis]
MKWLSLALLLLTGCTNPNLSKLQGRTLWTAEGCAYFVKSGGPNYNSAMIYRAPDSDKATCQEAPQ